VLYKYAITVTILVGTPPAIKSLLKDFTGSN